MEVHCSCGKFMGTILEGSKLRKGWTIQCAECKDKFEKIEISMKFSKIGSEKSPYGENPFGNIFGDLFNPKR